MPKQLVRICPSDRFCRVQNLLTSSAELIWPITELYFRQILSTDFLNRFYQDVKTGPNRWKHLLLIGRLRATLRANVVIACLQPSPSNVPTHMEYLIPILYAKRLAIIGYALIKYRSDAILSVVKYNYLLLVLEVFNRTLIPCSR